MIKIAFCDDDLSVLDEIRELLDRYRVERNQEIDYRAFHNQLDLLSAIDSGVRFDILLLDIIMPGGTGIDAAMEIRKYDSNVKILFLTSSTEYAVQSYAVGAFFYQLKPIWAESFFNLMDNVLGVCEKEQTNSLILRCKNGITRIELKQLEYCEVLHRTLFIHLTGGKVLESIGSLNKLSELLEPYGNFLRIHRSYLINLEYVQNLSSRAITMSCETEIPVPHGKYNEIKDAFLEYSFQDRKVII